MLVNVNKVDLEKALSTVLKAVEKNSQLMKWGIYFKASGDSLEIQSNNFSRGVVAKIPASATVEGEFSVPEKNLLSVVKTLPDELVTISREENLVLIKSGVAKFKLVLSEQEEFPLNKIPEGLTTIEMPCETFRYMVKRTVIACAKDDYNPIYCGVLFEVRGNKLILAGTNTHRLALTETNLSETYPDARIIIPFESAKLVADVCSRSGSVKISFSDKTAAFEVENFVILTRLVAGFFPLVDCFLNGDKNTTINVKVNADTISKCLNRAFAVDLDEYNPVILLFGEEQNEIFVTAGKSDSGWTEEIINAKVEGGSLKIAMNGKYLEDSLRNFVGKECTLKMSESIKPMFIFDSGDENYRYVVTPLRV